MPVRPVLILGCYTMLLGRDEGENSTVRYHGLLLEYTIFHKLHN